MLYPGKKEKVEMDKIDRNDFDAFIRRTMDAKHGAVYHQPNPDGTYTDVKYDDREFEVRNNGARDYLVFIGRDNIKIPEGLTDGYGLFEELTERNDLPDLEFNHKGLYQLLSCENPLGRPAQSPVEEIFVSQINNMVINNQKVHEYRMESGDEKDLVLSFLDNHGDLDEDENPVHNYIGVLCHIGRVHQIVAVAVNENLHISMDNAERVEEDFHFYPIEDYIRDKLPDPIGMSQSTYVDHVNDILEGLQSAAHDGGCTFSCDIDYIAECYLQRAYRRRFLEKYPMMEQYSSKLVYTEYKDSEGELYQLITVFGDEPIGLWDEHDNRFYSADLEELEQDEPEKDEPEIDEIGK